SPLVVVEPKLDGVAIAARYLAGRLERVLTRGGGQAGEDVTAQFDDGNVDGLPLELPEELTLEVRGECYMTDRQFEEANRLRIDVEHKEAFVNARNATAGSVRALHRGYHTPMTLAAYSVHGDDAPAENHLHQMARLTELGFTPAGSVVDVAGDHRDIDGMLRTIDDMGRTRSSLDFDIDGSVLKADSPAVREAAGSTGS